MKASSSNRIRIRWAITLTILLLTGFYLHKERISLPENAELVIFLLFMGLLGLFSHQRRGAPRFPRKPTSQKTKRIKLEPSKYELLEREFHLTKSLATGRWRRQYGDVGDRIIIHTDPHNCLRVVMQLPLDVFAAKKFFTELSLGSFVEKMNMIKCAGTKDGSAVEWKGHLRTKPFWPISARESFLMGMGRMMPDGSYLAIGCSTKGVQNVEGAVEMQINLMATLVSPTSVGHSELLFILDYDPRGFIPQSLKNALLRQYLPQYLIQLRESMEGVRMMKAPNTILTLEMISQRLDYIEKRIRVDEDEGSPFNRSTMVKWLPWFISGSVALYLFNSRRNKI